MSEGETGAEPESPETADPADDVEFSPSRIAAAALALFLLAFVVLVLSRLASPGQWEFGLDVETELAAIEFQPQADTRWRVDGAVICSRDPLPFPEQYRLEDPRSVCGGRWQGWRIDAPEQVLTIRGAATVMLQTTTDRLAVTLKAAEASVGDFTVVGRVEAVPLGGAVNLFWDHEHRTDALTFPFIGATTLGRAVNWSDPGMLRSGSVAVYTADDSADRRTQVDQADLMLGDQVRLEGSADDVWPKGFVRVGEAREGEETLLQVVAFGRADSLSIERYGDSGYDFRPDDVTRLFNDPLVAFWGSMLLVYISVVLSVVPLLEGRAPESVPRRYRRWRLLMKRRNS